MTITGTAKGMLYLTQMAWSISTITTATAKGMHQTHMEDKKPRRNMLVEHPAMTHQEIADYFGVSRAAIAQIETVALRKFKTAVEARGFVFEDFFGDQWDKT
jgi:hypothetical protein